MWFSKKTVEDVCRKNIQEELDNFLPDNGTGYVNGSLPRRPYYWYEKAAVKREAYEKSVAELRRMANDD